MFFNSILRILINCFVVVYWAYAQTDSACITPLTSSLRSDQFSASSEYDALHNASAARISGVGWSASKGGSNEYLQIDLETVHQLTSIDVQGSNIGWYTRSFRLTYSNDGYTWHGYNTRLSSDSLGELFSRTNTVTEVLFEPPILARFILINPITSYGYPAIQIEMYGCSSTDSSPSGTVTKIQGDIEIDSTWIPSQSPILIDRPLVVRSSAELRVLAGVNIIFTDPAAQMDVYGTLTIEGLQGIPVLFSSAHPILSYRNEWQGVFQRAGGNLNLTYAVIRQAVTGIQGNGSSVKIVSCEIYSCEYGIQLSGGISANISSDIVKEKMIIVDTVSHNNNYGLRVHGELSNPFIPIGYSSFSQNSHTGISIKNWDLSSNADIKNNVSITDCRLNNNTRFGLEMSEDTDTDIHILNSECIGSGSYGVFVIRYYGRGSNVTIQISNSTFINNRNSGIYIDCRYCKSQVESVVNNVFSGHSKEAVIIHYQQTESHWTEIRGNRFTNNYKDLKLTVDSKGQALILNNLFKNSRSAIQLAGYPLNTAYIELSSNTFIAHTSSYVYDESVVEIDRISTKMTNSVFSNLSVPTVVRYISGFKHTFTSNRFVNVSLSSCFVALRQAYDVDNDVNIDHNYWDTSDMSKIKTKICDFFMDSNKAIANLSVYHPTPGMDSEISVPDIDEFYFEADDSLNATIIGGIVRSKLYWLSNISHERIIVNRSILVTDAGSMMIGNTVLEFTNSRGIVSHGSLSIGSDAERTILVSDSNGIWNGIKLYSDGLQIENTHISGARRFVTVHGTDIDINLHNCTVSDETIQNLIYADMLNGNISATITGSYIQTKSSSVYINMNNTETVDLHISDTIVSSESSVIQVTGSRGETTHKRHILLDINNCSLFSRRNWVLNFESCLSPFSGTIRNSNLATAYRYDIAFFQFPLMDILITGNNFGDADDTLSFRFCNQLQLPSTISRVVNITGNVFNSSYDGRDVSIYNYYTNEQSHMISISNNTFICEGATSRARIQARGNSYEAKHTMIIDSNLFQNSTARQIDIDYGYLVVNITNNTFINNSQCFHFSSRYMMDVIEISRNLFFNNTVSEGVIYIENVLNNRTVISENTFINNTATVIAFKYSYEFYIRYNFFENGDDVYNIKILPDLTNANKVLNASLNYWGSTNVKEIAKTIYDKDYNINLLDVVFRPYLGSKNRMDVQNEDAIFITSGSEVGGKVNGNVTLSSDNSPYLVVSNVEVEPSDILIIEEGVKLLFHAGVGIKVYGLMDVLGSYDNPVNMLSKIPGVPWRGMEVRTNNISVIRYLRLNDTLDGLYINSSSFNAHNVTSTYAQKSGITLNVYVDMNVDHEVSKVRLSEVNLGHNDLNGLCIHGASTYMTTVIIEDCVVTENAHHGVEIDAGGEITLDGCRIKDNLESGIYIDQKELGFIYVNSSLISNNTKHALAGSVREGLVLTLCNITDHSRGYISYWQFRSYLNLRCIGRAKIEFHKTNFEDNIADGIHIIGSYYSSLYVKFDECRFSGGYRTVFVSDSGAWWKPIHFNISFTNNLFENNVWNTKRYSDHRLVEIVVKDSFGVDFSGNVFRNNTAETGVLFSSDRQDLLGRLSVNDNIFEQNNFASSTVELGFNTSAQLSRNVFKTQYQNDCIFKAPAFDINNDINATHNFWGTKDTKTVVDKVCGFEKDMSKIFVRYIPFFTDESLTHLAFQDPNTLEIGGAFGGEVVGGMVLRKDQHPSPIRIHRSILIRENASLTLEPGVVFQFETNKGIHVQGILDLQGHSESIRLEPVDEKSNWYGLTMNSVSKNNKNGSSIINTEIKGSVNGVVVLAPTVDIRKSNITNSTGSCLTIHQLLEHYIYDFRDSKIENCSKYGILLVGDGQSTLTNIGINRTKTGIGLSTTTGSLEIRSVNVTESEEAVNIRYSGTYDVGNVTIANSAFSQSLKGVSVYSSNIDKANRIKILKNYFENISSEVLQIDFPSYHYYYTRSRDDRTVEIQLNTFTNSCGVMVQTWNHDANLTVTDNIFRDAICEHERECFLYAYANGNVHGTKTRLFDISTNLFQNIHGKCVVLLKDNSVSNVKGEFVYNQLINNVVTEGVVTVDASYVNISRNIFDNPDSSFDVYGYKQGGGTVNVTNNWWGSSDATQALHRIVDQRRNKELVRFDIDPVLTERSMDCSGVNNCSSHGECVSPNRCRCYQGWTGDTCSDYDCVGVNGCYGNGKCIGPNTCECYEGWSGALCIIASCMNVNHCSGHGVCIQPDVCACAEKFTGSDCSACVKLHWGDSCQPCPNCDHGLCNLQTGHCDCAGNNWSGSLCDKCSETFYGSECLPLIKVLDIVPNQGQDKGGYSVHVWGHNFPETDNGNYTCKFGAKVTNGTWRAINHVECVAPQHPEGAITLEISPNGEEYTDDELKFVFYATCPTGSCGRDFTPSRGQCFFGGCSCFLPWIGEDCDQELFAPVIEKPSFNQTVEESSLYTLQLNLVKGDAPILWTLVTAPNGMNIDERTGLIRWTHAYAESKPYEIQARARNIIGHDSVTWQLNVPISYSAEVAKIEPEGVLPVPRPVRIYGTVYFTNDQSQRVVPVDIIVTSLKEGRETTIKELTDPLAPTEFQTTYFPRHNDAGLFSVTAKHPGADANMASNITWSVLSMRTNPTSVSVNEIILSDDGTVIVRNLSSLINIGNVEITNISYRVDGLPGAFIRKSGDESNSAFHLGSLAAGESVEFDLVVTNAKPLSGTIYVTFTSDVGTSTRLRVSIRLSIQRPNLVFDPPSLRENIVRGTMRIFDVMINNTGEVAATGSYVSIPSDDRLSIVSFAVLGQHMDSSGDMIIPAGGAALLSLSIRTADDAQLGEMAGTVFINSDLSSSFFKYKFFITSLVKFNITFTVKDEYTYFASGSPLVKNAKVKLVNPRRGYTETRYTSNDTGYVIFEDVYEDQYSLYAEADDHSSYAAVILVTPDDTDQDIFLQRTAVKYTWTVEPTTVKDVYKIELESTFETYVPMPVVTIDPVKVNTIPLELGEMDSIQFNITNHGLIRAENVRFVLPVNHPYLNFKMEDDFIGSVEANTSIIVPVKATLKARVKRNVIATAICGLAMLYDYICGGIQTRGVDVTLTREYPGRPPLPCGGGNSGVKGEPTTGGGVYYGATPSGTGRHSSVTYNPTTPLSCDTAKTLIKSCGLAFNPVTGCSVAVIDVFTAFDRSDGDAVVGTLNVVVGVADTAFACVFGVVCDLCGFFYSAIRCVEDIILASRRRREINSEVVSNMISAVRPMNNFLNMMAEILGDEGMYNIEAVWYPAFKKTVGEKSERGTILSPKEAASVLDTLTEHAQRANLSKFLERWNNTVAAWENGTLTDLENTGRVIGLTRLTPKIEQYLIDVDGAKGKGFASIFDEYDHAVNAYKTAEQQEQSSSGGSQKEDGVCARVRVRIVQELVLTRDAFNARLEIENGEDSNLESIKVEIQIQKRFGTGEIANNKFSIGTPQLVGISAVNGRGSLGRDLSGSAEWLIIPYSNAAPEDDTQYDVGGRLSYSVDGTEFSVPLLPDTITVKPNPSLVVHYFHEKYVQGDDPMTPEVEPVIPFTLGVMVMNNGYGIARALKITSGQPEIIENEKGLLISFKIIGAQLGNEPINPSLTVDFGDISSFDTKTARWLMTSSLMGTFYNFSATFENINPLGDPQLSLLDTLGYHELIHLVRIESFELDDGLDDFLVNDLVDNEALPDKLYNSANGTDIANVYTMNVSYINVTSFRTTKEYKSVRLVLTTNTSVWFYIREINAFTSPNPSDNEHLLSAEDSFGRRLLVGKNVWQTTHILDNFYLHLLDFIDNTGDDVSSEIEIDYTLIYGPRNMYPPRFNSSSYTTTISRSRPVDFDILTLHAYDLDKDDIKFSFRNENVTEFAIAAKMQTSAVIKVKESPLKPGQIVLEVIAMDSGIPSLSTAVNVSIQITDTNITHTTTTTTKPITKVTSTSVNENVTHVTNYTKESSTTDSSSMGTSTSSKNVTSTSVSSDSTSGSTSSFTNITTPSTKALENVSTASSIIPTASPTLGNTSSTHTRSTKTASTVDTTVSKQTINLSSESTKPFTTPSSGQDDKQDSDKRPMWIVPLSLGIVVLVLIVVVIVCFIRNK